MTKEHSQITKEKAMQTSQTSIFGLDRRYARNAQSRWLEHENFCAINYLYPHGPGEPTPLTITALRKRGTLEIDA